jgi:hypothetical protein
MRPYHRFIFSAIFLLPIALLSQFASADTIQLKDGREVKGIVIEEYKDRIIFSTPDGEAKILKADIKELNFDDEETNLVKLGDQARDNRQYMKAVGYYGSALKLNPNSKQAKDGLIYMQLYLSGKESSRMGTDIRKQNGIDSDGSFIATEKDESQALKEAQAELSRSLGLTLRPDGNLPQIGTVKPDSLAYDSGIRKGDILIAIWGRLTGYMTIKEVVDHLLKKTSPEIRCTIERTVEIKDLVGVSFSMELDGLTVSEVKDGSSAYASGLRGGDLIVAIDSDSTRYMPLKKAIERIRKAGGAVKLSLRRDVVVWRKD